MVGSRDLHTLMVGVAQAPLRVDAVAHELLELLGLWESALCGPIPYERAVHMHLKDAARTGLKRDLAQVLAEGAEEFGSVPACPQKPAALHAEVDLDSRAFHFTILNNPNIEIG